MSSTAPEGAGAGRNAAPLAAATLAFLALASACAPYVAKPVDLRQTAAAFEARRLDDETTHSALERWRPERAATWPLASWDRGDLLAVALESSPAIARARAELEAARAARESAKKRLPTGLTLLTEYSSQAQDVEGASSPWLLGVAADLPLDRGARRAARIASADLAADRALLDLAEEIWRSRRALATALDRMELVGAEITALKAMLVDRDEQRQSLARRVELGEEARLVLDRADAAATADRVRGIGLESRLASARAELARALGVPLAALDGVQLAESSGSIAPSLPPELDAWRAESLVARTDVRAAVVDYSLAEQEVRLEVARQYPDLRLGPGYIWERGVVKLPFDLSLALPPADLNRSRIAEAEARREVAGRRLEEAQAGVFAEVDGAREAFETARAALELARGPALDQARALESSTDRALRAGDADRRDLVEARLVRRAAELVALEALGAASEATRALEDALRRPLGGPELELAHPIDPTVTTVGSTAEENPP